MRRIVRSGPRRHRKPSAHGGTVETSLFFLEREQERKKESSASKLHIFFLSAKHSKCHFNGQAFIISTCVKLFEGLICEKRDSCIWDDTQDSGSEASVKGPHTFLLGDTHKNMHDVAVPVERKNKPAQNHLPSCLPARIDNNGTNTL